MKIDNSPKALGSLQNTAGNRASGATASEKSATVSRPATADTSVSVKATMLHQVADTAAPFNSQKVAEIRQAIAEGRFQINPERIADGLIDNVREMLSRDRKTA